MSRPSAVVGYCPACGDETLARTPSGRIVCMNVDCPHPEAAGAILGIRETEHVVQLWAGDFTVQHPLIERAIDGDLFECTLHRRIAELDGPPHRPGLYRVHLTGSDWTWEPIHQEQP